MIQFFESKYPNFNIEAYLEEHDLQFKINDAGDHKEIAFNCPKCEENGEPTPDTHKKLWLNIESYKFHCYRCKWSGSLGKLVATISKVPFEKALRILRGAPMDPMDHLNFNLFEEKFDLTDDQEDALRELELPYGYQPIEGPHSYLKERGVPWRYAAEHDWGFSEVGFTKDRIIVPSFMEGRLVFWQARATWDDPDNKHFKKVLNPSGVSARHVLYNYDVAAEHDEIVIVEGFMDAVKMGPNAVATNGKRLHPQQVEWLQKTNAKKIVLAWDADAWTDHKGNAGKGRGYRPCSMELATDLLRSFSFQVRCARLPAGQDPGSFEYLSDDLKDLISSAKEPVFGNLMSI